MNAKYSVHSASDNGGSVREFLIQDTVQRAKQEHDLLKEELQDIYQQACIVRREQNEIRLNREMRQLKDSVTHFIKEWSAHTRWEESELFPFAANYWGEEPDLFALMEQEFELAEQFIRGFLQTLDRAVVLLPQEEARRMASYLIQAYAILKNRFSEEEEIILLLTDRSNSFAY
ncbi:hemerythrin domain-containing protein [Cohnella kolymensis]|uniref:hemerythrin domain-containing protein n=1 Tax=Cohnella kolymensis TaxID=1590652 RepID=UPI00069866CA|nr:hemerythrin domain-containing protein [Cohnella kolymensis]